MQIKRSTTIDTVLTIVGVLSIIGGVIGALAMWPSSDIGNALVNSLLSGMAVNFLVAGVVGGILFMALGTTVRILDEIRSGIIFSDTFSVRNVGEEGASDKPAGPPVSSEMMKWEEHKGYSVVETSEGAFEVRNKNGDQVPGSKVYKSRETAKDFIDFVSR